MLLSPSVTVYKSLTFM